MKAFFFVCVALVICASAKEKWRDPDYVLTEEEKKLGWQELAKKWEEEDMKERYPLPSRRHLRDDEIISLEEGIAAAKRDKEMAAQAEAKKKPVAGERVTWERVMKELGNERPYLEDRSNHFSILLKAAIAAEEKKLLYDQTLSSESLQAIAIRVEKEIEDQRNAPIPQAPSYPSKDDGTKAELEKLRRRLNSMEIQAAYEEDLREMDNRRKIAQMEAIQRQNQADNARLQAALVDQAAQAQAERIRKEKTDSYNREFQMRQIAEDAARDAQRRAEWDDKVEAHHERIKH